MHSIPTILHLTMNVTFEEFKVDDKTSSAVLQKLEVNRSCKSYEL